MFLIKYVLEFKLWVEKLVTENGDSTLLPLSLVLSFVTLLVKLFSVENELDDDEHVSGENCDSCKVAVL